MSINEEVINPNLTKLKAPKFKSDIAITENFIYPLPNMFSFMCFVGPPRSGKTSLMYSLITTKGIYRKVFNKIYIVCPDTSFKNIKNNKFEKIPQDQIYNELSVEVLEELKIKFKENIDEDDEASNLLVIDDMASHLKDNAIQTILKELILNRRHLHLMIFLVSQSFNLIPLTLRKTINYIAFWNSGNKKEAQSIFDELISVKKEMADNIADYAFKKAHDFIFLNVQDRLYFRNFNKLDFNEN